MKERPILFSAPMVRAILAGTKTQTRRVVKPVGDDDGFVLQDYGDGWWPYRSDDGESTMKNGMEIPHACPYGQPGDRLWVRETCRAEELQDGLDGVRYLADDGFIGIQSDSDAVDRWLALRDYGKRPSPMARVNAVPSIHMPRWASRITLEVTGVRVERLQDISEADAVAEGIERGIGFPGWYRHSLPGDSPGLAEAGKAGKCPTAFARLAYRALWESINGPGSWDANPWVWVVGFNRMKGNAA